MKPTKITLSGTFQKNRAVELLNAVALDGTWTVSLSNKKMTRTEQQRKYYFMIAGILAPEWGYEKNELHRTYLEEQYLPLYAMRDDSGTHGRRLELVQKCRQKGDIEAVGLLIDGVTSNDATKDENSQVIESIVRQAAESGIRLPEPDQRGLY